MEKIVKYIIMRIHCYIRRPEVEAEHQQVVREYLEGVVVVRVQLASVLVESHLLIL